MGRDNDLLPRSIGSGDDSVGIDPSRCLVLLHTGIPGIATDPTPCKMIVILNLSQYSKDHILSTNSRAPLVELSSTESFHPAGVVWVLREPMVMHGGPCGGLQH